MVDNSAYKVTMGRSADSRHSLGIDVHMGVRDEAESLQTNCMGSHSLWGHLSFCPYSSQPPPSIQGAPVLTKALYS